MNRLGCRLLPSKASSRCSRSRNCPQAPEFVEGVINLRGRILPVLDLRKRLGVFQTEFSKDTRMVVFNLEKATVGMIVNRVDEVLRINDELVEVLPAITSSVDSRFISGIAKIGTKLVILFDLIKVLDASETAELATAAAV
jgi:purine-binding chemotaxis protein CheW